MAEDRVWPDDFTYGFGGPSRQPAPQPVAATREDLAKFDARRWCIEQVVAVRAAAPHPDPKPLHEEARALFDFLFAGAA